jgi:flagellar motor switch protein FliG
MRKKHRNLRKAAILLASLEAPHAESLLEQMSSDQAYVLRQAVARLADIDPEEQNDVIEEFFRIGPMVPDKDPSGLELDDRLPAQLSVSDDLAGREPSHEQDAAPFGCLRTAPAQSLSPFLEREHPQTIAVVVSHLPSERAAEVLAGLPGDLQIEVARRLVDLDETDPEILREVERGLESWLGEQVRGDRKRTAGMTALANILGAASPGAKQHILANLARHDRQLAGKLNAPVQPPLSFAQLEQMDAASLTVVLHHAAGELLVLALAGASQEFAERVFELFRPAEARALAEALRHLGPTRLSDVEEAQHELTELARQLELRGEIAPDVRGRLSVAV